ncbi:msl8611 [Mesorhizobium japonicum MAFF 303099]|uniref:Msl8611 protein n=1 Tax=Mesorhizobium japonicum (strain LMG 29417 / CECT 9101 / MAFF 303099) TaxID=266835 RepID=Q98JJ4_RHILO|nr:msl8611 [Mesorhizobium japonicum MAFF 303099]
MPIFGWRSGYAFASTRITSDSGTTPSCAIASAAALLCISAAILSISGTSIITATRFGFCGSTKVRMLVIPSEPKSSLRLGELSQCLLSFVML